MNFSFYFEWQGHVLPCSPSFSLDLDQLCTLTRKLLLRLDLIWKSYAANTARFDATLYAWATPKALSKLGKKNRNFLYLSLHAEICIHEANTVYFKKILMSLSLSRWNCAKEINLTDLKQKVKKLLMYIPRIQIYLHEFCICYFHPSFPGALSWDQFCFIWFARPGRAGQLSCCQAPLKTPLEPVFPINSVYCSWDSLVGLHTFRRRENGLQLRPLHFLSLDLSPFFMGLSHLSAFCPHARAKMETVPRRQ